MNIFKKLSTFLLVCTLFALSYTSAYATGGSMTNVCKKLPNGNYVQIRVGLLEANMVLNLYSGSYIGICVSPSPSASAQPSSTPEPTVAPTSSPEPSSEPSSTPEPTVEPSSEPSASPQESAQPSSTPQVSAEVRTDLSDGRSDGKTDSLGCLKPSDNCGRVAGVSNANLTLPETGSHDLEWSLLFASVAIAVGFIIRKVTQNEFSKWDKLGEKNNE